MRRRDFLASLAVAVSGTVRASGQPAAGNAGRRIQTVRGAVPVEALGMTLPHEHVLVEGMPHGFAQMEFFPQARQTIDRMVEFLRKHLRVE